MPKITERYLNLEAIPMFSTTTNYSWLELAFKKIKIIDDFTLENTESFFLATYLQILFLNVQKPITCLSNLLMQVRVEIHNNTLGLIESKLECTCVNKILRIDE